MAQELNVGTITEALSFPKFFEVETVNACNASCNMCTIQQWKKRNSYLMTNGLWNKFLDEVKDYASWIDRVNVSRDGEPLLDLHLEDKIRGLKKNTIRFVTLATNASLLSADRARLLLDSGLDDIMFSVDAVKKETFEKIRIGLKFEEVVKNCINFLKLRDAGGYKTTVRVRMVLQDQNFDELEEWMCYWREFLREGDRAYAKPAHSWGNQLESYLKITKTIKRKDYSGASCISPWSTMVVKVNGDIPLCPMDYKCTKLMGNVGRNTIKQIWGSEGFSQIREKLLSGGRNNIALCRNCYLWDRDTVIEDEGSYLNER